MDISLRSDQIETDRALQALVALAPQGLSRFFRHRSAGTYLQTERDRRAVTHRGRAEAGQRYPEAYL